MKNFKRVFILSGLAVLIFSSMAFAGDSTSMNLSYQDIDAKAESNIKMESGVASNGEKVTLNTKWKEPPNVLVTSQSSPSFSHSYSSQNQEIRSFVQNFECNNGICSFVPVSQLKLKSRSGTLPRPSGTSCDYKYSSCPNTIKTGSVTTPKNTGPVTVTAYFAQSRDVDGLTYKGYIHVGSKRYLVMKDTGKNKFWRTRTITVNAGGSVPIYASLYRKIWGSHLDNRRVKITKNIPYTIKSATIAGGQLKYIAVGEAEEP